MQPPDQLSTVLIWIAAIFVAVREGVERWPAARLALPGMSAGWLNFAPMALLVIAAVVTMVRSGERRAAVQVSSGVPQRPDHPQPAKNIETPLKPSLFPVTPDGRVFLADSLSAVELMKLCAGKTSVQAAHAAAPYIGKWFRYRGPIRDVYVLSQTMAVSLNLADDPDSIAKVKAYVEDKSLSDVLHKGEEIEVIGRITEIDDLTVELRDAEITYR